MLPLLTLLLAAPPLDPEAAVGYRWRVGVRFDPPAAFTPAFRERVCRELAAALRPVADGVGRVEVRDLRATPDPDRTPFERLFLDKSWAVFDADDARTLTGVKHHLVRVTVRDGVYRLEARQLDGSTGLASPQVRARTGRDPQEVGREAGLLLHGEFGVVGTVERDGPQADTATVRFKGGTLPGFDRLAKAGDVFAVGVVSEKRRPVERDKRGRPVPQKAGDPVPLEGVPRPQVLLRLDADPVGGVARCKVLSAFAEPLPVPRGAVGVRCLKLLTADAPLSVRVVGADGKPAAAGLLTVRATDSGFDAPPDPRDGLELRDGVYRSVRPLRGVACLVVGLPGGRAERHPLAVTGGGPLTVRFTVDPQEAARAAFARECEDFRGRVAEAVEALGQLNAALADLLIKGQNDLALVRAGQGLAVLEADDKQFTADLLRLTADPLAADPRAAELLASAGRQVDGLRSVRPAIKGKADELQAAAARKADPAVLEREFRAKALADRIKQLVEVGEVPEALDLFDQLLEVVPNDDTRRQKAKLADDWKPKDADHRRARDWVAEVWRRLPADLPAARAAADRLPGAVATLTAKEDRLGLRQLVAGFEGVYVKLKAVADKLDPAGDAGRKGLEELTELSAGLRKQEEAARAAVRKVEGAR